MLRKSIAAVAVLGLLALGMATARADEPVAAPSATNIVPAVQMANPDGVQVAVEPVRWGHAWGGRAWGGYYRPYYGGYWGGYYRPYYSGYWGGYYRPYSYYGGYPYYSYYAYPNYGYYSYYSPYYYW
jgi:hypothetical protein